MCSPEFWLYLNLFLIFRMDDLIERQDGNGGEDIWAGRSLKGRRTWTWWNWNTDFPEYPAQDVCHNELRWWEQYPTALGNLVEVLPQFQRDQDLDLLGYRCHPYRAVRVIPQGYRNPKMFACPPRKEGASLMRWRSVSGEGTCKVRCWLDVPTLEDKLSDLRWSRQDQ